ncbi:hypothetical protein CI105_04015 [Candidatus Izimaplasma bacterium ZiA1]|uniref:ATP-dependent DNA helicase n=1 Tax=Candidatus Izimoplasma sp. ZiA1 TaxID=2024899 RepID=UPI000BAA3B5B|nr:hypothetical protein CI105_04015 [Candidatus Izimaplasma bacterium ZiA1]
MKKVKIGVKDIIDFIYSGGDLVSEFRLKKRAQIGTLAHQHLQNQYNDEDEKEVFLETLFDYEDYSLHITGRIDGLLKENDKYIIEEIKSTHLNLEQIKIDTRIDYLMQVKMYAYMYLVKNDLKSVNIRLTYISIDNYETKSFDKRFNKTQLIKFFEKTITEYTNWLKIYDAHQESKLTSIEGLTFPFEDFREGQYKFMGAVYQTLIKEDILYSIAPTGIGKTIASIFSGLKTIKNKSEKIFYLTAKNAGKEIVIETINLLKQNGLNMKTTVINSKENMCLMDKVDCDPDICPYSKGYFEREKKAISDIFVHTDVYTKNIIKDYAKFHDICPHEFSLSLSNYSDLVVCDYNYAFDPRTHLIRYFDDEFYTPKLLVDEAHNLIDRTRSMYSATINLNTFKELKKVIKSIKPSPRVQLNKLIKYVEEFCMENDLDKEPFYYTDELDVEILKIAEKLMVKLEQVISENKKIPARDKILDAYFELIAFTKISEYYNDKYRFIVEKNKDEISVTLSCLDASEFILDTINRRVSGIVFFSATLTPVDYYSKLITAGAGKTIKIDSPFKQRNLGLYIVDDISTRYKDRIRSIDQVIDVIYAMAEAKTGNYIVFFPSYQYLNMVLEKFDCESYNVFVQKRNMNMHSRQEMLKSFQEKTIETKIGFFVLGGSFSEGIDYVGDMLNGVVIVGVALPQFNKFNELLRSHFDETFGEGYEYSYTYPGMNKVIQSVGRVIRRESDRGIAILIDDRYTNHKYRKLYPENWSHYKVINDSTKLQNTIEKFFNVK